MPIDANGQPVWGNGQTPYMGAKPVSADQTLPLAGRGVFIAATAAGNVRLRLQDGSFLVVPVAVGPTLFDNLGVTGFTASGTTATAVVSVLV